MRRNGIFMTRGSSFRVSQLSLLFLLVVPADSKVKSYNAGRLTDVGLEEVSAPVTIFNTTMPLSFGTMYTFVIESEGVNYCAACFSKTKRGYAADWTVHDMVTFRIDRDNLFLKRTNGKELRLLVLTKTRDSDHSTAPSSTSHLRPSRRNVPECH